MLTQIFLYSLAILGLYFASREGMILEFLQAPFLWASDMKYTADLERLPVSWLVKVLLFFDKPFIDCPTCMSSIWGTLLYFSFGGELSKEWPLTIFILAGMNTIIMRMYDWMKND